MEKKSKKHFVLVHAGCHGAWSWYKVKTLLEAAGQCVSAIDLAASVAHSMGGIPAALAADIFPCNTAAIVFLTSSMPDTKNPPAYVFEKLIASIPPEEFLDTVFGSYGTCDRPLQTILFGQKFLAEKFYQLSPVEDLEVAKLLVRVNPLVTNNLAGTRRFSEEGNFPPREVIKIKDADHMPMNSKPQELCACLLKIADTYA
ncbi:hypothetical protein DY000_02034222 [Brassica cretica]|uniref:AB hydrolase-1 domain-containing protein n=1 Tax=Brassica cretica TaxID=69181 RepID=A0ABQ7DXU3_BRACR|nr:hypothetical protein DY000_02034222 [Brassica cretica]